MYVCHRISAHDPRGVRIAAAAKRKRQNHFRNDSKKPKQPEELPGKQHRTESRYGGRPRVVTDRGLVAKLRAAGKSLGEIAAEMSLSKTTVARIAREAAAA